MDHSLNFVLIELIQNSLNVVNLYIHGNENVNEVSHFKIDTYLFDVNAIRQVLILKFVIFPSEKSLVSS